MSPHFVVSLDQRYAYVGTSFLFFVGGLGEPSAGLNDFSTMCSPMPRMTAFGQRGATTAHLYIGAVKQCRIDVPFNLVLALPVHSLLTCKTCDMATPGTDLRHQPREVCGVLEESWLRLVGSRRPLTNRGKKSTSDRWNVCPHCPAQGIAPSVKEL